MRYFWFYFNLLGTLMILACNEPTIIGSDLFNSAMNTYFTDTLTLTTQLYRDDSVKTSPVIDGTLLRKYLLGKIDNMISGKTTCGIYAQLRLPSNNINLGNNIIFDSLVLQLKIADIYGDTNKLMSLNIYEVIEDMGNGTQIYYNQKQFSTSNLLGNKQNFRVQKGQNILRIPMDNNFGQQLMAQSNTPNLSTTLAFQSYLKGLSIQPQTADNQTMLQIDMADVLSKMILYYHSTTDTIAFDFPITKESQISNYIFRDITNTELSLGLMSPNHSNRTLCSPIGSYIKMSIPHIHTLGKISINKAELVVTELVPFVSSIYESKQILFLMRDSNHIFQFGNDYTKEDAQYFGGKKIQITKNGQLISQYSINIAHYVQESLKNSFPQKEAVLIAFPRDDQFSQVVLGNENHTLQNAKLQLTYTIIP